jgi:glycyl-tRNA synthetase alpha subunit
MTTGVQFTGSLTPNQTKRWFTFGWNAAQHIVWYMQPTSPALGAPELEWSVAVERANATQVTYWLTVKNLTGGNITFEGRYAILNYHVNATLFLKK